MTEYISECYQFPKHSSCNYFTLRLQEDSSHLSHPNRGLYPQGLVFINKPLFRKRTDSQPHTSVNTCASYGENTDEDAGAQAGCHINRRTEDICHEPGGWAWVCGVSSVPISSELRQSLLVGGEMFIRREIKGGCKGSGNS